MPSSMKYQNMSIQELFQLNNRVAVVTGGRRGLGQAIAYALAQAGADIACVSRSGNATETEQLVRNEGRKFLDIQADLSKPEERTGLIAKICEEMGGIDILVNNAGNSHRFPPEEYPLNKWNQLLEIHLHASFDLSQQAAPFMMKKGRGKIINLGSVMSFEGGHDIPAYAAAKHGIAGLTKSLANSWSSKGINVNCIAPGYFNTDMPGPLKHDAERYQQILDRIPCGRWGEPDELGGLAVFLASNASNYMHGSIVSIDGGWLAR